MGPPFHLGALGNCLIGLVEGPALTLFTTVTGLGDGFGYQSEKKKAPVAAHTTGEFQHPTGGVVNPITDGVQSVDKPQISNLNSTKSVEVLPQSTRLKIFQIKR